MNNWTALNCSETWCLENINPVKDDFNQQNDTISICVYYPVKTNHQATE